jgi:hypothetical protein
MANAIFAKGREAWGNGDIDWEGDTIRAALVDLQGLTIDTGTMQFLKEITDLVGDALVANALLANCSNVNGVLDADDTEFTAVEGDQVEALVIYKDTGVPATSNLLIYFDTTAASDAIELVPNGGSITSRWNASGIATL